MRWHFSFISHEGKIYTYAYSRESSPLDGKIIFNEVTQHIYIEACSDDKPYGKRATDMAIEHFWKVIREGFPKERQVDCG